MLRVDQIAINSMLDEMVDTVRQIYNKNIRIFGVPRGGIPVAHMLATRWTFGTATVTYRATDADLIVDDICDSGATRDRYAATGLPFLTLFDKQRDIRWKDQWLIMPWEVGEQDKDESATDIVTRLFEYIGEDPTREGLKETPARFLKAWKEWSSGYGQNPTDVLKTFVDGSEGVDEMVVVKDLPFYSHCEHHLAPFFGTATIGYLPNKRIVGLSKFARLLQIYSRRLQVQERLTCQIADAINNTLNPLGCGVIVRARHLCMESRGICQQGHYTVTSALRGVFKEEDSARSEFLGMK
jgi:GTP cyclohydrolase I